MELGFALRNTVMYVAQLFLASWTPVGLREAKNAYFSVLTHTKQLLLVMFCDTTVQELEIWRWDANAASADAIWTDRREG